MRAICGLKMENIFFLVLVAVVGLVRWLSQVAENKRNAEAAKRSGTAPSNLRARWLRAARRRPKRNGSESFSKRWVFRHRPIRRRKFSRGKSRPRLPRSAQFSRSIHFRCRAVVLRNRAPIPVRRRSCSLRRFQTRCRCPRARRQFWRGRAHPDRTSRVLRNSRSGISTKRSRRILFARRSANSRGQEPRRPLRAEFRRSSGNRTRFARCNGVARDLRSAAQHAGGRTVVIAPCKARA